MLLPILVILIALKGFERIKGHALDKKHYKIIIMHYSILYRYHKLFTIEIDSLEFAMHDAI